MSTDTERALERAHELAREWLRTVADRPVRPAVDADAVTASLPPDLPADGEDPVAVVEELARTVEPGLMAMGSPRFFGFVIGGALPAGLGADWLVSAWDQNTGSRQPTPGTAGVEEVAGRWILQLLGLPPESGVGFVTGGTAANLSCILAARDEVLRRVGADAATDGLHAGPPVRFLAGDQVHTSMRLAGRLSGLGAPRTVGADREGRIDLDGLAAALAEEEGPAVVALQAGDVHSGAFDDLARAIDICHDGGAWAHVDGAFGLWAAASPRLRHLVDGVEHADSWATDAHKTLNVPYDCGVAIVRDRAAMSAALGAHADYLPAVGAVPDPYDLTPELSRRARGVPVWAVLRSLGRHGVAALVERLAGSAAGIADGVRGIPGLEVCNDVVYTQVCVAASDDDRTTALGEWLRSEGTVWASSSVWNGRVIVRFSVSNHGTDEAQVRRTVDALRRGAAAVA